MNDYPRRAQHRPAGSRQSRWKCHCSLALAEHWLGLLTEAALVGETDAALIPEAVEHYLVTVQRIGAPA